MKRFVCLSALSLICFSTTLRADDNTAASNAAASASRQEAQENYNTLKAQVEDLISAREDTMHRLQELSKEISDMRAEMSKPSEHYASAEELKKLAEAVQEIDKKREEDKQLILKEIEKLAKAVSAPPPEHTSSRRNKPSVTETSTKPTPANSNEGGEQTGFYYTIKSDDTLSLIAKAYREQGIKVTTRQIQEANPNVNPAKLIVGTKIFIPAPKGSVPKSQ